MLAVIGAIIRIGLYLVACYFAFVWVVGPAMPFVLVSGVAVGVLLPLVVLVGTLLRIDRFAAPAVTPFEVRTRLPKTRTNFERDRAWPNYLFAQSRTDLTTALKHTTSTVAGMWTRTTAWVRQEPGVLFFWPLLLLLLVGAITLTGVVVATAVAAYALLGAVLIVAWLGWLLVVGVLRGADLGVRMLRRARATCHHAGCNHRSMLPAYRCQCGLVHHDIRAGRQGAFVRRCQCGRLVPTTVLQAAAGLVAVCQNCNRELRAGAAVMTDVLVPVFGPASAGKTRLVLAGMVALTRHLAAVGGSLRPVGPESEATLNEATVVVESGRQTTKTDATKPPAGITVRLTVARRDALLHLFDAAGEFFSNREQNSELPFLRDAQGLVFVLDPFSVPAVSDDLRGALAPRLSKAQPAQMHPELSYLVTVQWLRDQGVALTRKPLAVAVVKADLLIGLPPAAGLDPHAESGEIDTWLREKGLDNMLDGAARDFGEVRFFLVSSLDVGTGVGGRVDCTSPARPLLWLLGQSGVAFAEQKVAVAS